MRFLCFFVDWAYSCLYVQDIYIFHHHHNNDNGSNPIPLNSLSTGRIAFSPPKDSPFLGRQLLARADILEHST